ncbi:MAG: peptidoglycan-binding protein [Streptosporangiaceae bacterium]
MSTQSYTPNQQAPYQQAPYQQLPRQPGGGPSWFRIWSVVIGTALAVAVVALAVALSQSHSSQAPATNGTPTSTSVPAQPATPVSPVHPAQPTTPVSPVHPVQPSAAVVKLQQELGQLNYYEGPDDGIMGPQTIQAITYLQRDAGLPQTGQMNAATQAALANFLAHGNNQMAG